MKKVIALCFVMTFFACDSSAQPGIRFEKGVFKTAMEKAKKEKKYLFVDVYTTWCPPCKYMSEKIFTQKSVGDYFNATFVNFKVDAERGEGPAFMQRYRVEAFPTFLLLDGEGNLVGKMVGGSPAEEFIEQVKELKAKADLNSVKREE